MLINDTSEIIGVDLFNRDILLRKRFVYGALRVEVLTGLKEASPGWDLYRLGKCSFTNRLLLGQKIVEFFFSVLSWSGQVFVGFKPGDNFCQRMGVMLFVVLSQLQSDGDFLLITCSFILSVLFTHLTTSFLYETV